MASVWKWAIFFRKSAIGLSCRKYLLPVYKLKFSEEVYDQDVTSIFISGSSFLQWMASIITVKEDFYFLILRDFVLDFPGRIFLLLPVQKEYNYWSQFSKFHCVLKITAIVRTFLMPLQVEQQVNCPIPGFMPVDQTWVKHMAASTGCIPKEKMVRMTTDLFLHLSGEELSSYVLTEPTLWKSHAHEGISLRNYLMDCSMWMLSQALPWGLVGIWCPARASLPRACSSLGESSRLCLKERYVQGKGKSQGQRKSPSYQWADELIMTLWAGFISVLGYCSLLFTVVWLHDGCSNNKVINLVMTQDSLFLLEKGSDNNR